MKKTLSVTLLALIICLVIVGCSNGDSKNTTTSTTTTAATTTTTASKANALPPVMGDDITPTDYTKSENWLSIPTTDLPVDVFYLYPTCWTKTDEDPHYCEIDNLTLREGAEFNLQAQASVFDTVANIYAPMYRQIDALWLLEEDMLEEGQKYFDGIPYTDAVAAFEYYIENYNNGRPFILAGHSQGANVIKSILKYYMAEHPEVYSRMVCAYVLGYSVTEQELADYPHLKFAEAANDYGVIVSWNTEAPGTEENAVIFDGALAINPLNWSRTNQYSPKEYNRGSLLANRLTGEITPMEYFADAELDPDRGVVLCYSVDVDTYAAGGLFPKGSFHMYEFGFYYNNIRENAAFRIESFMNP